MQKVKAKRGKIKLRSEQTRTDPLLDIADCQCKMSSQPFFCFSTAPRRINLSPAPLAPVLYAPIHHTSTHHGRPTDAFDVSHFVWILCVFQVHVMFSLSINEIIKNVHFHHCPRDESCTSPLLRRIPNRTVSRPAEVDISKLNGERMHNLLIPRNDRDTAGDFGEHTINIRPE